MHITLRPTIYFGVKGQFGVIWGHRGQNVIFAINAFIHPFLHSMTIMLVHYLENLYLCCGVKGQTGVIWVTGFKRSFLPKCYNLFMLHSMVMKSYMCISLRSFTYFTESKVYLGTVGGHMVQKVIFFPKSFVTCHVK